MEEELSYTRKNLDYLSMEVTFLKMFIANKLSLSLDEMSYGQKIKKMKIFDKIKVNIGDTLMQNYLMNTLSFDIYFESKVSLPDQMIWKVIFYENGKEGINSEVLKQITLQVKTGSVQIKLSIPPPKIENYVIEDLVKNGASIKITCVYKQNNFYEATFGFDIVRSSHKIPQDPMIIYGMLSPNYQPPPLPEGECAYLL